MVSKKEQNRASYAKIISQTWHLYAFVLLGSLGSCLLLIRAIASKVAFFMSSCPWCEIVRPIFAQLCVQVLISDLGLATTQACMVFEL